LARPSRSWRVLLLRRPRVLLLLLQLLDLRLLRGQLLLRGRGLVGFLIWRAQRRCW